METAEFYRREADRLYSMADAFMYADVREDLIRIAQRYEILARQSVEHGQSTPPRPPR